MGVIKATEAEDRAVLKVAEEMMAAVRTAPKTRGVDDIESVIVFGPELEELAREMERKWGEKGEGIRSAFRRDAETLRRASAAVLVGIKDWGPKKPERPIDCGGCGYPTCAEFLKASRLDGEDYGGPNCIWQLVDLGIALGSAVKTASLANIDNRIMYTLGVAARKLGMIKGEVVLGIPLAVTGKNIFFDR